MVTVRTRSRVAADGTVTVPVGTHDAGTEVEVVITPVVKMAKDMTRQEWVEFVQRTAGSIQDPTFERPPQGDPEQRDSLD